MTHTRKHYKNKNRAERKVDNLDRADRAKEKIHRERMAGSIPYYKLEMGKIVWDQGELNRLLRWYSKPDRNCPGWVQELQRLTGKRLENRVNDILRNGLHTK